MTIRQLAGTTAVVTGASRGFGRAISVSLVERGAHVVGVARNQELLAQLKEQLGDAFTPEVADVADPTVATRLIADYRPQTVVLNAGATPPVGSLPEQTWEMFSTNWNVDVQHVFNFTREILTGPLDPGSVVVSLSSGAALAGSPLSGGYAGAKATIKLISSYAGLEAQRLGVDIRFVSVLPQLTPATGLGKIYTERYAAMAGMSEAQFLEGRFGGTLSAEQVGESITDLAVDDSYTYPAYLVGTTGLQSVE
jgi:NAD(P)-dependent dehydrogenase (short-subunit alcohol dehydrogenase family)